MTSRKNSTYIVYTSNGLQTRPVKPFVSSMYAEDDRIPVFTLPNLVLFGFLVILGITVYYLWDSILWVISPFLVSSFVYLPIGWRPADYITREMGKGEYSLWTKESGQFIYIERAYSRKDGIRRFSILARDYTNVYIYDDQGEIITRSGVGRIAYDQLS